MTAKLLFFKCITHVCRNYGTQSSFIATVVISVFSRKSLILQKNKKDS